MGSAFSLRFARANVEVVGDKDGVNDTFTLPNSESYVPASLQVHLNGQLLQPDSIQKNGPGYTTFTIVGGENIPISTDVLTASYSVVTS